MTDCDGFSRAAVFTAPGRPLEIRRFPLPVPRGGEVIARIRCATICGSDLHTYSGRRQSPAPSILGHEMVGEICAIGPGGARDFVGVPLSIGDRVTWSMVWSCGSCYYCARGLRPKCERLMKFGHEAIGPGCELTGGFAEHCFLREGTAIFRVPDSLADTVASPANCATATVAAVIRKAGNLEGKTVAVIGTGMLGLTACAMASARSARCVVAIEPDAKRAALAVRFGATTALDGIAERGADIVLEFSGAPDAVECGFGLLGPGGTYVLAGATYPTRPVRVSAEQIVRRMIQVIGVYNYQPEDLGRALDFLVETGGRFPFEALVERSFGLDDVNAAMQFAEEARPPRIAIVPEVV